MTPKTDCQVCLGGMLGLGYECTGCGAVGTENGRIEKGWYRMTAMIDRSKATYGVVCSRCNTQRTAPSIEAALDMTCPGCGR